MQKRRDNHINDRGIPSDEQEKGGAAAIIHKMNLPLFRSHPQTNMYTSILATLKLIELWNIFEEIITICPSCMYPSLNN